jgi:hypothetical protein
MLRQRVRIHVGPSQQHRTLPLRRDHFLANDSLGPPASAEFELGDQPVLGDQGKSMINSVLPRGDAVYNKRLG